MSRARAGLTATAAVASALGTLTLAPLFSGAGWMAPSIGAVAVVATVAGLSRLVRLPAPVELPLVAGGVLCYVTGVFAPRHAWLGVVPSLATFNDLHRLLVAAGTDIARLPAPVPPSNDLVLVAVLGVAGMALIVDLAAVVALSPTLAGLALLAAYVLSSLLSPNGVSAWPFLAATLGWLALLGQDERARLLRWSAEAGTAASGRPDSGIAISGRRVGLAAVGVALIVPLLAPDIGHVRLGAGPGGDGAASVTTYNPLVAVQGDLTRSRPNPLLVYRTNDPHPDYLQMTTLDTFNGSAWSATPLTAGTQARISNGIPSDVDAMAQPGIDVTTQVQVLDSLSTRWLPAPEPLETASAPGDWRYDPTSGTIFSAQTTSQGLAYTITSRHIAPDPTTIGPASAPGDGLPHRYLALPRGLPRSIAATARRVTAGAHAPFAKAVALQDWLRSPPFVYSLTTANASGSNAIVAFLKAKRGFCEQYAATMAVMARTLGIPARVAVGFTPGTPTGHGSYVVTTADAHAWPELYFVGVGWLRFEPTPRGDGQATAPDYTTNPAVAPAVPGSSPTPPTATPATGTGSAGSGSPQERNSVRGGGSAASRHGGGAGWPLPLGIALALAALAAPGTYRAALRRRRLRGSAPVAVLWAELADTAVDLGVGWPADHSPRAAARRLAATGLAGAPAAALGRLVTAEERRRYAPGGQPAAAASRADLSAVLRALGHLAGRPRQALAATFPPSTLRRAGAGVAKLLETVDAGVVRAATAAGGWAAGVRRRASRRQALVRSP